MNRRDRREFTRVEVDIDVQLRVAGLLRPPCRARDLSAIGTRLETDGLLPVGTPCELVFSYPAQPTSGEMLLRVEGLVARVLDGALGIEFTGIDPASYEHLRNLLRFHAENPDAVELELREHLGIRRNPA